MYNVHMYIYMYMFTNISLYVSYFTHQSYDSTVYVWRVQNISCNCYYRIRLHQKRDVLRRIYSNFQIICIHEIRVCFDFLNASRKLQNMFLNVCLLHKNHIGQQPPKRHYYLNLANISSQTNQGAEFLCHAYGMNTGSNPIFSKIHVFVIFVGTHVGQISSGYIEEAIFHLMLYN